MRKNKWIRIYGRYLWKVKGFRYHQGLIALVLGLLTIFVLVSLQIGLQSERDQMALNRGDAFRFSLSKRVGERGDGLFLTLERREAPSFDEAAQFKREITTLNIAPNIAFFFPESTLLTFDQRDDVFAEMRPFADLPADLPYIGHVPRHLEEIMINDQMAIVLGVTKDKLLGQEIILTVEKKIRNYYQGQTIADTFRLPRSWKIVAIIDEATFMNQPALYYSYPLAKTFLENTPLRFLSLSQGQVISWYQWLLSLSPSLGYQSYDMWLFVANKMDARDLISLIQDLSDSSPYVLESATVQINEVLTNFLTLTEQMLWVLSLLLIFLVGAILSFLTWSHYLADQPENGLLYTLGVSPSALGLLYVYQMERLGMWAYILTLGIYSLVKGLINWLVMQKVGLSPLGTLSPFFLMTLGVCITFFLFILGYGTVMFSQNKEIDLMLKED